jgi:hypothetical protein
VWGHVTHAYTGVNLTESLGVLLSFRGRPILVLGSAHVYSPDQPPATPSTEGGALTPREEPEVDTTGVWLAVQQVKASQPASQQASQSASQPASKPASDAMPASDASMRHTRHHYCG